MATSAKLSGVRSLLLLPVLTYLASHLLLALAAYWHGYGWLSTGSRIRWDGGIYLDIARTGYYAAPCGQLNPSVGDPDAYCGNAGWFPLFPYLVRGLTKVTGLELNVTGVLVTELCALGMLVVMWQLLGAAATGPSRFACLAVAAFLPSGVYFHATFPMSLSVLLVLVTFALLQRGRWVLAGLTGAAAATAYPLAVLLAPAAVLMVLVAPGRWSWRRLATTAYIGGLPCAGVLAVFGLMWLNAGHFDAYLRIQSRYGNGVHNPVRTFLTWLARPELAVRNEMLFSAGLVALALLAVVRASARQRATPLDWALAAVYGPLLLITPLVAGVNQAQFRSHTLLLPVVLVLRHLRTPVPAVLAALAVPLAFVMATLFLTGVLV